MVLFFVVGWGNTWGRFMELNRVWTMIRWLQQSATQWWGYSSKLDVEGRGVRQTSITVPWPAHSLVTIAYGLWPSLSWWWERYVVRGVTGSSVGGTAQHMGWDYGDGRVHNRGKPGLVRFLLRRYTRHIQWQGWGFIRVNCQQGELKTGRVCELEGCTEHKEERKSICAWERD